MKLKIKKTKKVKEILATAMRVYLFTDEDLERRVRDAEEGNFPASISIIFHNQRIINDKLNKLLKKKINGRGNKRRTKTR